VTSGGAGVARVSICSLVCAALPFRIGSRWQSSPARSTIWSCGRDRSETSSSRSPSSRLAWRSAAFGEPRRAAKVGPSEPSRGPSRPPRLASAADAHVAHHLVDNAPQAGDIGFRTSAAASSSWTSARKVSRAVWLRLPTLHRSDQAASSSGLSQSRLSTCSEAIAVSKTHGPVGRPASWASISRSISSRWAS
jgi:hypothetical protein